MTIPDGIPRLVLHERPARGPIVTLAAVGDIGLSGQIETAAGGDVSRLFEEIAPALTACDVAFGNLESSVTAGTRAMFAGSANAVSGLRGAGFSLLHVANNHVSDYGSAGLGATLDALEAGGITPLGGGRSEAEARAVVRTDRHGVRVGWIGCGRTLTPQPEGGPRYWEYDEEALIAAAAAARRDVDALIVSIHIGMMWIDYPRPDFQPFARRLMAAGADVVLAHHAHVLQGVEVADGRVCCYNLGNCLFDWTEGNVVIPILQELQRQSAVFFFDLDAAGVCRAAAAPIVVDDAWHVRWARGQTGDAILARLARLNAEMRADFTAAFERQRAERNTDAILKVIAFHAKRGHWSYVFDSLKRARPEHVRMLFRRFTGSRPPG